MVRRTAAARTVLPTFPQNVLGFTEVLVMEMHGLRQGCVLFPEDRGSLLPICAVTVRVHQIFGGLYSS